jgi:1,2-diacylglycerol 3-alpha-glucosyltransferase
MSGRNLKKKYGFALQVQVHTDLFSPYFKQTSFLNRIRFHMAKKILPCAQEIRVVSPRIKRSLVEKLSIAADTIDILPIYIAKNPARDQAQAFTREKYGQFMFTLLMVGRFAFEKNIPFALDIMTEVLKKYPKAGLVIVGDGPEKSFLHQKVQELGIQNSVVFEPWQTDLEPYYKRSQAFLHTSYYEGYGLVLIEAALHRLPIVTSDVGIAGDVLKDGESACVCPINNRKIFIENIFKIIENNSFRMEIATHAFEAAQNVVIPKEEYIRQYAALLTKAHKNI